MEIRYIIEVNYFNIIPVVISNGEIAKVGNRIHKVFDNEEAEYIKNWATTTANSKFIEVKDINNAKSTLVPPTDCIICKAENLDRLISYFLGGDGTKW